MPASTKARGPARTRTITLMLATAVAATLVFAPAASAGKPTANGGGGKPSAGTSSMTLVVLDSADGLPHWNGNIRFDVSSTATTEPHVDVVCSQAGTVVYTAQTGYFPSYPWPWTQTFNLSSGAWTGGAADCTAKLYWFNGSKTVVGKTMSFHVEP